MKKKGFTLVELLGVLVVLSIILIVVVPTLTSSLKRSSKLKYEEFTSDVLASSELYVEENREKFPNLEEVGGVVVFPVKSLVKEGYIKSTTKDPNTEDKINQYDGVKVTVLEDNTFQYEYPIDLPNAIIDVTGNPTSWTNQNVTLTIVTDSVYYFSGNAYSFDGGKSWQSSPSKTFTENQTVEIWVRDEFEDIVDKKTVNITKIDKVVPAITFKVTSGTSGSNSWYKSNINVQMSPTSGSSGVKEYSYCITTGNSCSPSTKVNSGNATTVTLSSETSTNKICYIVTSNSGQVKSGCSSNYKIDKTSPVLTVGGHTSDYTITHEAGVTFTAPSYTVSDNLTSNPSVTRSGSVTPTVAGTYTLTYTATDSAGNIKSIVVTVKVQVVNYTITYNLNGGINNSSNPSSYHRQSNTITLATPTRTGYTFQGWYTDSALTNQVTNIPKGSSGNKVFYAKWSVNSYILTFNYGKDSCDNLPSTTTSTITYGSSYGTLPSPKKTNYNFAGWYTASSGGSQVNSSTAMGASNTTVYAHWTKKDSSNLTVSNLIAKANAASITTYTGGDVCEMYTFSHVATQQTSALTDYRYIGNTPNNYIIFNNETWRIVGIFYQNGDWKIKIVRNTSIGRMYFNNNYAGGYATASLKDYLNGTYLNSLGSSSYIASVTWYLGFANKDYYNNVGINGTPDYLYIYERMNDGYPDRARNWTGKVGLLYFSDYKYTYESNGLSNSSQSWIRNTINYNTWLITSYSGHERCAWYVENTGGVPCGVPNTWSNDVRPSVYLNSSVRVSGTGTSSDPYRIIN